MEIPALFGLAPEVVGVLVAITILLVGGTIYRGVTLLRNPAPRSWEDWRSLGTWWLLHGVLVGMLIVGRLGVVIVMIVAALLVFRELLALVTAVGWRGFGVALAVLVPMVGPYFVIAVAFLPNPPTGLEGLGAGPVGWEGWLLTLLILTELNDIAQKWWGRRLGKRPLAPKLSPNKTWEGFWGGMATTVVAALFLAPVVTPLGRMHPPGLEAPFPPWLWSVALGLLIACGGVAGDLTASFLKRRAGVKDSSDLLVSGEVLPAHGGILDRLDSLSLTAPLYYVFAFLVWGKPW